MYKFTALLIVVPVVLVARTDVKAADCQETCLGACARHSGAFGVSELDKACVQRCLQMECTDDSLNSRIEPINAVDDQAVRKWIERGFRHDTCAVLGTTAHDLNNIDEPQSLNIAWAFLKACRDSGNSKNLSLAAAENYLFIRWAASYTGDTGYEIAPRWYYTLKVAASKTGLLDRLKTSSQPVSEPSEDVLRWGQLGYQHGIRDYERRTGNKAALKTAALETTLRFLADRYYSVSSR